MGAELRQRFLVVDDEPLVVRSLESTLRRRGDVIAAASVAEARKVMANHPTWDALLADLRLPDGSGLDLIAEFRRRFPDIPAALLSGHIEGDVANAAFDLGAEVMGKPCDSARIYEFLDGCRRHARRPALSSAPPSSDVTGEALEETIGRLRSLLERPSEALTRYAVGAIIARLKRQPHGAGAVQAAAEALGEDLASLYRFAKVAERWSAEQVERLLARKGPNGHRLSWSHLVVLAGIECDAIRALYLERTIEEALSVRSLTGVLTDAQVIGSTQR